MPGWNNSNRREQLPKDWATRIRPAVLRRDPTCMRCGINPATDADHKGDRNDHRLENLQGLCQPCHQRKTIDERPRPATSRRPPEAHPGLVPQSQPYNNGGTLPAGLLVTTNNTGKPEPVLRLGGHMSEQPVEQNDVDNVEQLDADQAQTGADTEAEAGAEAGGETDASDNAQA